MKKLLPFFVYCISFFAVSQNVQREDIYGKIIVEGSDIVGITIYNSSSNLGAVTNEKGEFKIAVALNDLIEISALKYQNLSVRVNEAMLASKRMNIYLIEEINKLENVIISAKRLTGNIRIDLNNVKEFKPKRDAIYFGIKNKDADYVRGDAVNQIDDMNRQTKTLINGLNIINVVDQLLIPLFRSEVRDKRAAGIPEVPVKSIKYYLGSNFLVENFNIPEHRVEEFIRYVEDEAFDFDLLNYGHEMEFLELLSKKSKAFLKAKKDTD